MSPGIWCGAIALLSVFVAPCAAQEDVYGQDLEFAARAFQRGELRKAESIWLEILAEADAAGTAPDAPPREVVHQCRMGIVAIRFRAGDDAGVWRELDGLTEAERVGFHARRFEIDSLLRQGGFVDAEARIHAALEQFSDGPQGIELRYRLGALMLDTGRRAEGESVLQKVGEAAGDDAVTLTFSARALMRLGGRHNVEDASARLVAAIRADPDGWLPRTLYGILRFEVYGEWSGAASGERALLDVLERNGEIEDALVALYRIRRQNHLLEPAKTENFLDRALAANPRSVPALLERGKSWLDDRRFDQAARFLESALAVHPNDREVLAQRTAAAIILNDAKGAAAYRARALALDPSWGGVDRAIGDRLVALYRFKDALPYYAAALAADADDVLALHGRAKALVYAGRGEEARELLVRAREIQKGYVNPWRNNVIAAQDLLDEEYVSIEDGGFRFWLHRDDAEVLRRYLLPFAKDAKAALDAKYGLVPDGPVRFESFHTWDDFSVRTTGFRGFPALGACFGPMITFVSPVDGDLRRNDFMWQATAWHEYTHVLTLALSKHRVPRWLTEGFSVYEERQRDRSWERGMERDLLDAFHNGEIAPIALFDRVFRGPRILFGYYQGGLLVDFLAGEFGFAKVVDLLRAYGEDLSAEDAFERTFGVDTKTIDARFLEWVSRERLARIHVVPHYNDVAVDGFRMRVARDPGDADAQLALAWSALQRGVDVDAGTRLREVLIREPEHPYGLLVQAEILRRRGRSAEAVESYERGFSNGAEDFDSRIACAELLEAAGDADGALRHYFAAKRAWPGCTDQAVAPELRIARIHRAADRDVEAMMEISSYCSRTARAFAPRRELAAFAKANGDRRQEAEFLEETIAIDPFDRGVHSDLAEAYVELGRDDLAVRELEAMLAIPPELDRANAGRARNEVAGVDSPEFREEQAATAVRLARVLRRLGREEAARAALERAVRESPDGDAAAAARELRDRR